MGPVEAFRKLGYRLASAYDWSASRSDGVCVALWRDEIDWKREPTPVFDTRMDAGPGDWLLNPKAIDRIMLLETARKRHDGRVDVVVRDGGPDDNPGTAEAWNRGGTYWRCDELDAEAGEFVMRLYKQ